MRWGVRARVPSCVRVRVRSCVRVRVRVRLCGRVSVCVNATTTHAPNLGMVKTWLRTRIQSAYTDPSVIQTDTGTIKTPWDCFQALKDHFDTDEWRAEARRKGNKVGRQNYISPP